MKIFVSGQIQDVEAVHDIQQKLIRAGHSITHDWTQNETGNNTMLASDADKLKDIDETARRAKLDIQGVIACDAFVLCTDNQHVGKGMYAELGAALALAVSRGTPRVYVVGAQRHMSVFYFHPLAVHKETIDEVIEELNAQK
ncbi:MAG TPA: hypothetical protein VLF59_00265 [Candidatus Saccharimonadales bacterium]|nr:hypothetical protein [Candidatus Saccharimonadales bacterium]